MKAFLLRRWFLLCLGIVIATGFWKSETLLFVADFPPLRYALVAAVLFLMALPLEARAMWGTMRHLRVPALGVAMNSAAIPLFVWFLVTAGGTWFFGRELSLGLLVTSATPCTLASASVWTRRAGGNDAASIMVTMITNGTCFLVTPFWLLVTTGEHAELDGYQMIVKLALIVVLPMSVAQLVRLPRPVGWWATRHKISLAVWAQIGVLAMVFLGAVQTGHRFSSTGSRSSVGELGMLVLAVVGIHVLALVVGMAIARRLRFARRDQIAVGFAGSQKTLMVGLQVSLDLGFNIIPILTYHVSQLLVDTVIADRLRRGHEPQTASGGPECKMKNAK